jgi:3D (Asp-Asp-Asp) domain-containing protein
MKKGRFSPFRWLVSFSLAAFYLHFLRVEPAKLNPALEWGNPTFDFVATAYCVPGITASGVDAAPGMVAADLRVLPIGSVISVETDVHRGIYRVTDTGPLLRGKHIDVFIPGWNRAVEYGRKRVKVTVLQYGGPENSWSRPVEVKSPGVVQHSDVLVQ